MFLIIGSEVQLIPDWTVIIEFFIFAAVLIVLSTFVFKPMIKLFDERKKFTADAHEESRRLTEEAEKLESARRDKLGSALNKAHSEKEEQLVRKRAEADKTISNARVEAKNLLDSTDTSIEYSTERVDEEMETQAAALAKEIMDKIGAAN